MDSTNLGAEEIAEAHAWARSQGRGWRAERSETDDRLVFLNVLTPRSERGKGWEATDAVAATIERTGAGLVAHNRHGAVLPPARTIGALLTGIARLEAGAAKRQRRTGAFAYYPPHLQEPDARAA